GSGPQGGDVSQASLGTAFTYQGRLTDGGSPANGSYDFRFILYDDAVGGSQVGGIVTVDDQTVTEGLFTVLLDFGSSAFTGDARYLEVAVRPGASTGDYSTLSPRQALTPAPYALNADLLDGQHASAFWKLTGNSGTTPGTHFLGTADNQALELKVNGARALRLEPHATSPNVIGGYSGNSVTGGVYGATIAGGGESGYTNRVTDDYGTVGGGYNNQAGGNSATVGGGISNNASSDYATVGGGSNNTAYTYATVGGGYGNYATGDSATVPGGRHARADHYGQMAYASGRFAETGDAQSSLYVMRRRTTSDGVWESLYLDGYDDRLTLYNDRALTFEILIIGRSEGDESAGYLIQGVIENDMWVTGLVGTLTVTTLGEDDATWDVRVRADNTNDALDVQVLGNGETIRWVATVRTAEVAW
ncbi:MAG TPA: hypothetical protein VMY80_03025, partial [Anaerolineae bacterium]|nr:hypothetical protein [Anaerolineae bacterium]